MGNKILLCCLLSLSLFLLAASPALAVSYYVSPNGSDTNPGTQEQPWRTIRKAVDTVMDGTVIVMAGSYPEFISVGKSNISFIAEGKVNMLGFSVTGNHNLIRGFTITNPSKNFGIMVTGNNNTFEKNDISNTKADGIRFFGSGNNFIGNYIHDIVDRSLITTDPHVDCFQTWGPAENIVFEKNFCNNTSTYGSNQIVMLENITPPVRNISFKNNVLIMRDGGYANMNFERKAGQSEISNIVIVNNTIVHLNGTSQEAIDLITITGAQVQNNIFIDFGGQYRPYVFFEGGTNINISNNAVYKSDNVAPAGGPFPNDIWMQDLGLADYKNYDFHLKPTSPLIDRGYYLGSLVVGDYDGTSRPQGAGYDIGAYEYVDSSVSKMGDVNANGVVNIIDIGIILDNYGKVASNYPKADINSDGVINIIDIGIIIDNYGK